MLYDDPFARRDLPGRELDDWAPTEEFRGPEDETPTDVHFDGEDDGENDDAEVPVGDPDVDNDAEEQSVITSWLAAPPAICMTQECFLKLMWRLGRGQFRCEEAGLLIGPVGQDLVIDFVEDQHGHSTSASFTLNGKRLTRIVRQLKPRGKEVKGIAHSHPDGVTNPSGGDLRYLSRLFKNPKNDGTQQIIFPIVCRQRLWPYIVTAAGEVCTADLVLV